MADGRKQYVIEINGIQQSIDAVESLNRQLDALEKRIDSLSKRNISISASGGGNTKALDEEAKMLQQIDQLHQKVAASEKAEYQELLHAKEELKEYQQIAKSLAAQDNLKSGINDTSTMMGMKAQLKDIKTAMQTLDVESDKFKQLQQEANELNNKLKEIEQGYGQFGRNVGNYANGVAEGMQKIVIKVGETAREFDNAREASRTLNMELKSMALNGQQGTKEYNDLNEAVKQMNSTLKDVEVSSVAMDNLLDTMQGIVAIASTAKGIGALFGLDDGAIEQAIQKLVALQNVLQGIEVIRRQMQSQEGIGLILSKGNKAVDKLVASIFGIGTASKAANIAAKTLSATLKGLGIGLAIAGIMELINTIESWSDKQKKAAEEIETEAEKMKKAIDDQRSAYVNAAAQYSNAASRLSHLRVEYEKTNDQLKKTGILKEASNEFKKLGINIKGVNDAQTMLVKNGGKVIELLRLQGDAAAIAALRMEAFKKSFNMLLENGYDASTASILAGSNKTVAELDKRLDEINPKIAKLKNELGIDETVKSNGKKTEDAVKKAEQNISNARINAMKDGLVKTLAQLQLERNRRIEEAKKTGRMVKEQIAAINREFDQKERDARIKYHKENLEREKKYQDDLLAIQRDTNEKMYENSRLLNERKLNTEKNKYDYGLVGEGGREDTVKTLTYNYDMISEKMSTAFQQRLNLREFYYQKLTEATEDYYVKELEITKNGIEEETKEILEEEKKRHDALVKVFDVTDSIPQNQLNSFKSYMSSGTLINLDDKEIGKFFHKYREQLNEWIDGLEKELENGKITIEEYVQITGSTLYESYVKTKNDYDEFLKQYNKLSEADKNKNAKKLEDWTDKMNLAWLDYMRKVEQENDTHQNRMKVITSNGEERIKKIENDLLEERKRNITSFYSNMTAEYERAISSVSNKISRQTKTNAIGIFDYRQELENLKDLQNATADVMRRIEEDKKSLIDNLNHEEISFEDFDAAMDNLNTISNQAEDTAAQLSMKIKELPGEWWKTIDQWVQIIGQAATQIIQSIGDINQAAFEKQMEAIEKQTDELEKQLDKQRELTEKYKDDVDSIEDELATARGDRRQQLIDQLNAQMAAQRESLAQEKKMEKEREKLDKKKQQLEYENEMRKWRQSILTAAVNTALAISSAAVNTWPVPAIPMMAAAGVAGAVQMAAVLANKPKKYAEGGLLEGRSHAQGGIPVGNTGIEVEGKEYIINKRTTMQNVDVLDFVNSKKRKLTIDDFIDFYTKGSKVSRNVSSMRAKFEDGGQLPTIRTDIELNSRLVDTMERYSERPVQVEVVDIINKADDVRRVHNTKKGV